MTSKLRPSAVALLKRPLRGQVAFKKAPFVTSHHRALSSSASRLNVPTWPAPPVPQPPVGPSDDFTPNQPKGKPKTEESFLHAWTTSASFQAALTTVVGLVMVFGAGIGYLEWYKAHVLHRVCCSDIIKWST